MAPLPLQRGYARHPLGIKRDGYPYHPYGDATNRQVLVACLCRVIYDSRLKQVQYARRPMNDRQSETGDLPTT